MGDVHLLYNLTALVKRSRTYISQRVLTGKNVVGDTEGDCSLPCLLEIKNDWFKTNNIKEGQSQTFRLPRWKESYHVGSQHLQLSVLQPTSLG
jgi:hypothetical protein